jgi:hypothetical protein
MPPSVAYFQCSHGAEPAIPWYLTYRSQWPLKAVPANDLVIGGGGHIFSSILGLGLFWYPAFCQERLRQRHFGTTDNLACLPFGHANISTHGHLVLWTFRYGNISALWTSWHNYFNIDRGCSSSEMFPHCYLQSWPVVPTMDISAKMSTCLNM